MILLSRRGLLRGAAFAPAARLFGWQEPGVAPESTAPPKFSSDVKVVNLLATVRDKDGRIVTNLTKDDFSITEDGRPQVIRYFAQQFDSPLKLGLLVDTSGSERRNIAAERRASDKFIEQVLREDRDKAFLIHFDAQVELLQDLTSSRAKLEKALDDLTGDDPQAGQRQGRGRGGRGRGGGGTILYDAVFLAADEILRKEEGRKAAILFSDGDDTGSKESLSNAIEAAQRADMLVYSIRFYDPNGFGRPSVGFGGGRRRGGGFPSPGQGEREDGKRVLQRISAETGGAYFEASGSGTLDKIYARIQDELRNQYSLGYTSDQNGAGYRMIKITANGKNLTVQARQGYYAR